MGLVTGGTSTCATYHITGRQSGRTYYLRRDGGMRGLGWSVCAPGGAWYSQFVSLPQARKWALAH